MKKKLFQISRVLLGRFGSARRLKSLSRHRNVLALSALLPRRFPSRQQLWFLPRVLSPRKRAIALGALLAAIVSSSLLFWRLSAPWRITVPAVGGSYTEGVVGAPLSLNPLFASQSSADLDVIGLVYSPLFADDLQKKNFFAPVLAKDFAISQDGKTYTVDIRADVRWHDGRPLTVEDVLFTINRIQDPKVQSPFAAALPGVAARQSGPNQLTFTLAEPSSTFLASLTWGVIPKHRWEGRVNWQLMDPELIGSGPFHLKRLRRNDALSPTELELERFPASQKPPFIQTLTLKYFPTAQLALSALERRKIDGLLTRASSETDSLLKKREDLAGRSLPIPEYIALFFNPREQPLFSDPRLRNALARALPKAAMVDDAFSGAADVAAGIFTPEIYPVTQRPVEKPDRAKIERLFADSGWTLVQGVRVSAQKKVLRFSITTSDFPALKRLAESAAAVWRSYGAQVTVTTVEGHQRFSEVIRPRAYDVLLSGQNLSADPDPFAFWHSSQEDDPGLNLALWRNGKADELISQARAQANPEFRRALYSQLEELIAEDAPAVILAHPKVLSLLPKRLRGVNLTALASPADRFAGLSAWYLKTRSQWSFRRQ